MICMYIYIYKCTAQTLYIYTYIFCFSFICMCMYIMYIYFKPCPCPCPKDCLKEKFMWIHVRKVSHYIASLYIYSFHLLVYICIPVYVLYIDVYMPLWPTRRDGLLKFIYMKNILYISYIEKEERKKFYTYCAWMKLIIYFNVRIEDYEMFLILLIEIWCLRLLYFLF